MTRMIRVVLPVLLIALCVVPAFGSVLVRYCDGLDWTNKKCTGNCYISYQDVPGANETAWAWGPRGQKDSICVEWWGTVATTAGQCIIADADDGAQVFINNKLVIDKWNSHDVRGCPNKKGCATASGKLYIIYYNDYGKAHFSLKTGTCGAAETTFTALPATAFTGTPAIPADLVGNRLVKITNATCCYPSLAGAAGCGTKPTCDSVLPWAEIASISKTSEVTKSTYWVGNGEYSIVGPYILPCTQSLYVGTNGSNSEWLNGDNVVLKVTMGSNVDYYKPLPGYNLCDMLGSNRLHLWSKTGKPFTFIQPRYHNSDNTIGGSDNDWPKQFIPGDGRNYLSFWGGNGANGACCHDSPTSPSQWNREALLEVVPQLPGISRPAVDNTLPSWTKSVSTWLPFAWAHPDWQMEWQQYYPLTENGVLNDWTGINSGLYYYRSCGTYNQTGAGGLSSPNKFIFAICMGTTVEATLNCTGQVDYFRAALPNNNFCDVLRSKNLYEWAYDSSDPNPNNWKWARPEPYYNHFGGARDGWPVAFCKNQCQGVYQSAETCGYDPACYWKADWNSCLNNPNSTVPSPRCSEVRKYLPFWGGHYGGHGYLDAKAGEGVNAGQPQWRRSYMLRLAKIDTTK